MLFSVLVHFSIPLSIYENNAKNSIVPFIQPTYKKVQRNWFLFTSFVTILGHILLYPQKRVSEGAKKQETRENSIKNAVEQICVGKKRS